jgi:hypothetical protein
MRGACGEHAGSMRGQAQWPCCLGCPLVVARLNAADAAWAVAGEAEASTNVPNSEHLRFRVSGRVPGAHTWPGVAHWFPIDRGRKVVSSDGSCARLRGSSKMTGRPGLFQIGRPTRASSWSAHSVPARSQSTTLVPAHVRARACGVWRPSFRALTKAHRPMHRRSSPRRARSP